MWLIDSITLHPTTWALGAAYLSTAAINALPEPGSGKPAGVLIYQWLFDFLHVLSNRVIQKYPQYAGSTQPPIHPTVPPVVPTEPPPPGV